MAAELDRHGVRVRTGTTITGITGFAHGLTVSGHANGDCSGSFPVMVDVVLVVGVPLDTVIAETAGVALGVRGSDRGGSADVSQRPDIYAAGDCVHTFHYVLDADGYLPLGTIAGSSCGRERGRCRRDPRRIGHRSARVVLRTEVPAH